MATAVDSGVVALARLAPARAFNEGHGVAALEAFVGAQRRFVVGGKHLAALGHAGGVEKVVGRLAFAVDVVRARPVARALREARVPAHLAGGQTARGHHGGKQREHNPGWKSGAASGSPRHAVTLARCQRKPSRRPRPDRRPHSDADADADADMDSDSDSDSVSVSVSAPAAVSDPVSGLGPSRGHGPQGRPGGAC